ncbi:hypothetical protein FQA39_LY01224 [Lamprigera yunnana]|nr:hypothetical protein FQA39_LY01224 [Lamprigera yunnana]
MSLEEQFQKAAVDAKNLKSQPSNEELLDTYALYQQATAGDNNTDRPDESNIRETYKWNAWTGKKGISQEKAKEEYVAKESDVHMLIPPSLNKNIVFLYFLKKENNVFSNFVKVKNCIVCISETGLCLLERAITECTDSSLRVALKSIRNDLTSKKGCLVALNVFPRLGAKKHIFVVGGSKRELNNLNRSCESSYVTIERFDTFKR